MSKLILFLVLGSFTAFAADIGDKGIGAGVDLAKAGDTFDLKAKATAQEALKTEDPEEKKRLAEKAALEKQQADAMKQAGEGCKNSGERAKQDSPVPPNSQQQQPPEKKDEKPEAKPEPAKTEEKTVSLTPPPPSTADAQADQQRNKLVTEVAALNKEVNSLHAAAAAKPAPVAPTAQAVQQPVVAAVRPESSFAASTTTVATSEPRPAQVVTMAERLKAGGTARGFQAGSEK